MYTVQKYKTMRNAGISLHRKTTKIVPTKILIQVFKEFGHWKKGALACGEDDLPPMMDRLFYDKKWDGKGVVEHYICQRGEGALTDDEKEFSRVMKTNYFSLFFVHDALKRENAVIVEDMLDENPSDLKLVDMNLSKTAEPGMLMAARLIQVEEFYMTTGIAYPFLDEDDIFQYMMKKRMYGPRKHKTASYDYPLHFYKMHKLFGLGMEFKDV